MKTIQITTIILTGALGLVAATSSNAQCCTPVTGTSAIPGGKGIVVSPEATAANIPLAGGRNGTALGVTPTGNGGLNLGFGSGTTGAQKSGVAAVSKVEPGSVQVGTAITHNNQVMPLLNAQVDNKGPALGVAGKVLSVPGLLGH